MEAYGGALERARATDMTRAEKMARIAEGIANLHKSQGGLGMEGINQQLQAAQSFGQIDNLAQDSSYRRAVGGMQGGALPPLPAPSLANVAQGASPLQQATQAAAATGQVAGSAPIMPPSFSPLSPEPVAQQGGPQQQPPPQQMQQQQGPQPQMPRAQQLRAMIDHANRFSGSARAREDAKRWTEELKTLPEFVAEQKMAERGLIRGPGGFAPMPGTPAAQEAADRERQRQAGSEVKRVAAQTVFEDADRAVSILESHGNFAAGPGAMLGRLPGTAARELRGHIDSIKGNVGIDQLLKIKESGAGLGAIPQAQLEMLASLLGNLDAAQDPKVLAFNIRRVREIYEDIIRKEGGDPRQAFEERRARLSGGAGAGTSAPDPIEAEMRRRGLLR
jgi:ADP-ribose pyrophosphatase YjhB (NUDIX family)